MLHHGHVDGPEVGRHPSRSFPGRERPVQMIFTKRIVVCGLQDVRKVISVLSIRRGEVDVPVLVKIMEFRCPDLS